jgi:hypothetical protein
VSARKLEYGSAGRHVAKQIIARQVYDEIGRRKGRFLPKLAPGTVTNTTHHGKHCYVADELVALEKVKQALRDKHDFVEPPTAGATAIVVEPMVAYHADDPPTLNARRSAHVLVVGAAPSVRAAEPRNVDVWTLPRPEQQRLWASQQYQRSNQTPSTALLGTNVLSDMVGDAALSSDTSWLALLQQVQHDNRAQQIMAAEAKVQAQSQQRPLMHLSDDDLLEILQQDNRNRTEQELLQQQQQQQQMVSQWQRQQMASNLLRHQQGLQQWQPSQLSNLVRRRSLFGQSAHGWPSLQGRSSFPAPTVGVQRSVSTANSPLLPASMTKHSMMACPCLSAEIVACCPRLR